MTNKWINNTVEAQNYDHDFVQQRMDFKSVKIILSSISYMFWAI